MITRPLWRSRSAGSARQRDAWIAFEDSAVGRASSIAPGAMADGKDHRWVVSYQRGEIIALVQRVTELELRLQRRSRALAGALALIALGVAGSLGYWVAMSLPAPSEAPLPLATATSGGRESAPPPATFEPPRAAGPGPVGPDVSPVASPQAGLRLEADQRARASDQPVAGATAAASAQPDQHLVGGLPVTAPIYVTVTFAGNDADARQLAAALAEYLRSRA